MNKSSPRRRKTKSCAADDWFNDGYALIAGVVDPSAKGIGCAPVEMANFLDSNLPLTKTHRHTLAEWFRMLDARFARFPWGSQRGKSREPNRSPEVEAERKLARRMLAKGREWCNQHPTRAGLPRTKVPKWKYVELIKQDIACGDSLWHTKWQSAESWSEQVVNNVLRLLKYRSRL
jgi:hypothetical protein